MSFCSKCGARLADGAELCSQCGTSQSASAQFDPYSVGVNYVGGNSSVYVDPNAPIIPNFIEAVSICFQKYVSFQGRASRSEYWYWTLFTFLLNAAVGILLGYIAAASSAEESLDRAFEAVQIVLALAFFLPSVSVFVRRLHDTNHSGWLWWLPFLIWLSTVSTVGSVSFAFSIALLVVCLYMLILMISRGDEEPNEYGPAPVRR